MKFILDMVHHNPGERPFKSRFLDPAHLVVSGDSCGGLLGLGALLAARDAD